MSVIDKTAPLDTENAKSPSGTQGAVRMRDERRWLFDLFTAFRVRHQEPLVANDPGTTTGAFDIPFSPPAAPRAGDIFFTTGGLVYFIGTGIDTRLGGTLAAGSRKMFRQATAPTGWARDPALPDQSILIYRPSGGVSSGGSGLVSMAHVFTTGPSPDPSGSNTFPPSDVAPHDLKFLDVIVAVKDLGQIPPASIRSVTQQVSEQGARPHLLPGQLVGV